MTSVPPGSFWHPSSPRVPASRRAVLVGVVAAILGLELAAPGPARGYFPWQGAPARQVVVFGVVATPGSTEMDPKIAPVVQNQLRRLLPNHGFRLLKIKSERVVASGVVRCDLGGGFVAAARLDKPMDPNGKVQMHFELFQQEISQFQTIVATPADQFNFFDKAIPNGNRLLVGVGAR